MKLYFKLNELKEKAKILEKFIEEEDLIDILSNFNNPYSEIYVLNLYILELTDYIVRKKNELDILIEYQDIIQYLLRGKYD